VANCWVECELIGCAAAPSELQVLFILVHHLEADCFRLIDHTVTNSELIFFAKRKVFKSKWLSITLTDKCDFVAFVHVVLGLESQNEFLGLHDFRSKSDIEVVVRLAHDSVTH
jgi:hypothetical protein